jgi:hypothetical protein
MTHPEPTPESVELPDIPTEWVRGVAIAAALEAAHFSCDSGEDVDRFIEMLYQRGYEIAALAPAPTAPAGLPRILGLVREWLDDPDVFDGREELRALINPATPEPVEGEPNE